MNNKSMSITQEYGKNLIGIIKDFDVEGKIVSFRGEKVIFDRDVADLYGVETKRINEAVTNNPDKFPFDYIVSISFDDLETDPNLKSKFSTSSWGGARKPPKAFTEKGLYMLATILKGKRAVETTIQIIDTFAKIRELNRTIEAMQTTTTISKQKNLMGNYVKIISELIPDDMEIVEDETCIELNLAIFNFKRNYKRKKNNNDI